MHLDYDVDGLMQDMMWLYINYG